MTPATPPSPAPATPAPRLRASVADVLPVESATTFTAREYAAWLDVSPQAVKSRLGHTELTREVLGQRAKAWPLAGLPAEWLARLETLASQHHFRSVPALLCAARPQRWTPPVAWQKIPERYRKESSAWRDALAEHMPDWAAGNSRADIVSKAAGAFLKLTGRTVKPSRVEYVAMRAEQRDGGAGEFGGPALYLDDAAFKVHRSPAASVNWFPRFSALLELQPEDRENLTEEDRCEILQLAFTLLETESARQAQDRHRITRALADFLLEQFPSLSSSSASLKAKLRSDMPGWIGSGRAFEYFRDARKLKSGNFRRPDFSRDEREIAKLAVQLDGNESGARRMLENQGRLSPEFAAHYPLDQRANKSALPREVRRRITPLVEATTPFRRGEKTVRDQGPYITRKWDDVRPGDRFVFDDVKFNHPFKFRLPDGTCGVTCGECLMGVDSLTEHPLPFLLLPRTGYNGLDTKRLISRVHDQHGLPHHDVQLEGGTWESRFVVGVDEGWDSIHWRNFERGLNDPRIGIRVIHSRVHRAKVIEGYFGHVQNRMRCIPGFVGFNEREYRSEHMQKLIARARRQDAEALAQIPTQEQWRDWIVQIIEEFAHEPRNGARIPGRTAAEAWNEALLARPLRKLPEDVRHILDTHTKVARLDPKKGIRLKVPGYLNPICYVNEHTDALVSQGVQQVRVFMDLEHPERITVSNLKGTFRFAVEGQICHATRAGHEELARLRKMVRGHQASARALWGEIKSEVRSSIVRDDEHDEATREDGRFHREAMENFNGQKSAEEIEIASLRRRASRLSLTVNGNLEDPKIRGALDLELRGREMQAEKHPNQ